MLDEPAIATSDWNVFKTKLGEYTGNPRFGAAIAISDNPARIQEFETLSAAAGAPMRFSALIYDKTKLDEWGQTGYRTKCCCCAVDNPCHACDPCGLGWILCHIFPGGHCG